MKKIILTATAVLSAIFCYADGITVSSGSTDVFHEKETALFEVDWSGATVKGENLKSYLKSQDVASNDWTKYVDLAKDNFKYRLNKKNKSGLQVYADNSAKYKLVLKIEDVDLGAGGLTWIPGAKVKSGGCIISGKLNIVEISTGKSVCTMSIDEVKGMGGDSIKQRLSLCFFQIATDLLKAIKK